MKGSTARRHLPTLHTATLLPVWHLFQVIFLKAFSYMTAWCLLTDTSTFAKVALQCQVALLLRRYINIPFQIHVVSTTLI